MGGFANVDDGLWLILSVQGGSIGFEFARVGEREDNGGIYRGYEAYEVKTKKGENTLSLTSPEKEKHFFYIYDVITSP